MDSGELSNFVRLLCKHTSVGTLRTTGFDGNLWLSMIPRLIGTSLREAGIPGVVRYDGVCEGYHVYTVFCRLDHRYATLRLAYSSEKTGGIRLAAAILAELR